MGAGHPRRANLANVFEGRVNDVSVDTSNISSCKALRITTLTRLRIKDVPPRNETRGTFTWRRGHLQYPPCADVGSVADGAVIRSIALLLVCDRKFEGVIPATADIVRSLGISGVVGNVDSGDSPCAAARRAGLECLDRPTTGSVMQTVGTAVNDRSTFGKWYPRAARTLSVKVRFEYALRLMARGISVVMIDADVFFRPSCAAPAPTRTDPTKILR